MFLIESVEIDGSLLQLAEPPETRRNTFTVVTGANAEGKTRLLAGLADHFGRPEKRRKKEGRIRPVWSDSLMDGDRLKLLSADKPRCVVTQTFSPFSRFPRPERDRRSPVAHLFEAVVQKPIYRPVGLHQGMSFTSGSSLTRGVIERALYVLASEPKKSVIVRQSLEFLGFGSCLELEYRPVETKLFGLIEPWSDKNEVMRVVEQFVDELLNRDRGYSFTQREFLKELKESGRKDLVRALAEAYVEIQEARTSGGGITLKIDLAQDSEMLEGSLRGVKAALQLRWAGLMKMAACSLFRAGDGIRVDVAGASSGQQQIINTMFGVVAEMEDDSLLLLDEPELSLHPRWQYEFLGLLSHVLEPFTGCHIIIATHSPLIAQRAQQLGHGVVSLRQGGLVGRSGGEVQSVEGLLTDVFNTPVHNSQYLADRLFGMVAKAETGSNADRAKAIRELETLNRIYEQAAPRDEKAMKMIAQVRGLLEA